MDKASLILIFSFTSSQKMFFTTTIQIKMRPLSIDGAILIFVFSVYE